jgi:hypothetical protein
MTHGNPPPPTDGADELIVRAARDYNEPGPVPRDEIWNRIAEARRSKTGTEPIALPMRRTRYWMWPSVGVAAAGLVAIGVAIGRGVERTRAHDERISPAPLASASHDSQPTSGRTPDGAAAAPVKVLASDSSSARSESTSALAAGDGSSMNVAYKLAVVNHVVGSEAMITAFRASARRGDVDPQLAKWSRDLLGETRLLESAAPNDDVTMKRLLQDLELVLAQIVQYSNRGTHSPEDLDLIERSIQRRAVMSNIRNLSAGQLPSGT